MISRDQIETLLKINGVSSSSPDEHIRSVLLSARYTKDEVDTAIMVLREDVKTKQTRVDGLHKVFRTNEALAPAEVSALLGIDVSIADTIEQRQKARQLSTLQIMIVWLMSVAVAVSGIMFYMYMQKVGVFHPSVYASNK
ncbi:hypothetical protein KC902_00165 [Candidatus Kaiserbacteria bacterium]|nr:hypothetical protein [Candidatus Kaiserbacteria bacterium]USN88659.1 MAG: hypothetical protein H6780_04190 [Candidatus Nomurabacteria bacterium]